MINVCFKYMTIMKKILYTIIAALSFGFASCTDEGGIDCNTYGGKGLEFLHFATSGSFLIEKDSEAIEVEVGITSVSDQDRTFNISIDEASTAVEGKDFKLASKTVTIPAGKYIGTILIEPLYETMNQDETTTVVLALDTELISPAYGNTTQLNFTYAFTVDMDYLCGTWSATDYTTSGETEGPWTITISKKSDNEIYIENFWGGEETIIANVNFDDMTITLPAKQVIYKDATYGDCWLTYYKDDVDVDKAVTGTLSALGLRINNWCAHVADGEFGYYSYTFLEKK